MTVNLRSEHRTFGEVGEMVEFCVRTFGDIAEKAESSVHRKI